MIFCTYVCHSNLSCVRQRKDVATYCVQWLIWARIKDLFRKAEGDDVYKFFKSVGLIKLTIWNIYVLEGGMAPPLPCSNPVFQSWHNSLFNIPLHPTPLTKNYSPTNKYTKSIKLKRPARAREREPQLGRAKEVCSLWTISSSLPWCLTGNDLILCVALRK